MIRGISTKPVKDEKGRVIRDWKKRERRIAELTENLARNVGPCRICEGSCESRYHVVCPWCIEGKPKFGCLDCWQALPACACMSSIVKPMTGAA